MDFESVNPVRIGRGLVVATTLWALAAAGGCAPRSEGGKTSTPGAASPGAPATDTLRLPSAEVVAQFGGKTVTYGELREARKSAFEAVRRRHQREFYEVEQRELETWIVEQLVKRAAADKGLTDKKYLSSVAEKTEVSDEDVKAFYKEQVMSSGRPYDEVKDKIREFLVARKSQETIRTEIERLKTEAGLQMRVPPPPEAQVTFELAGRPVKGNERASVTLVEFSDFQCPYCSRANANIREILKAYPNDVKVYFLHYPLPMHEEAMPAAVASHCAHQQGKFWSMHDVIFENQRSLSSSKLEDLARSVGLDMTKYGTCVKNPETRAFVQADMEQGKGAGVQGTPTFFINGVQFPRGVPSVESIKAYLKKS